MRLKSVLLLLAGVWALAGCSQKSVPGKGFVAVKGNRFELDGQPYFFVGTNLWYGANLGADTARSGRERLRRELDRLYELGIRNLRLLGASEGTSGKTLQPAIQPTPGRYREDLLRGLDFLLAEMRERNMRAVVFLNNFWEWSGGMARYVSWTTGEPVPFPSDVPWTVFVNFSARFYTDTAANRLFYRYVDRLLNRRNTFTGVLYREDPTIMAWQLANEPRPGWGDFARQNEKAFVAWIRETAAHIKRIDPVHLVSIGSEGTVGCAGSADLFRVIHRIPQVDYVTFHLWAMNWGWFDPKKADETFPVAVEKALAYIREHVRMANELGKPAVMEEFGFPRDGKRFGPKDPVTLRDRYFERVLDEIYRLAKEGHAVAGSNFWAWGGEGRARDPQKPYWAPGDDFTGDPPHEPQGLYSIFDRDHSTLDVLRDYARRMEALPED